MSSKPHCQRSAAFTVRNGRIHQSKCLHGNPTKFLFSRKVPDYVWLLPFMYYLCHLFFWCPIFFFSREHRASPARLQVPGVCGWTGRRRPRAPAPRRCVGAERSTSTRPGCEPGPADASETIREYSSWSMSAWYMRSSSTLLWKSYLSIVRLYAHRYKGGLNALGILCQSTKGGEEKTQQLLPCYAITSVSHQ